METKGQTDWAKAGATFGFWNTAADGTGTEYDPGNKFAITSNVTLYAQWYITDGLSNGGVTTHYTFSYSENLKSPAGPEPARLHRAVHLVPVHPIRLQRDPDRRGGSLDAGRGLPQPHRRFRRPVPLLQEPARLLLPLHYYPSITSSAIAGPNPDNPWPLTFASFWVEKSTFGRDEVTDATTPPNNGSFPNSLWLVVDGLNRQVLGAATPTLSGSATTFHHMTVPSDPAGAEYEFPTKPLLPQRVRFPYDVDFAAGDLAFFPAPGAAPITLELDGAFTLGGNTASEAPSSNSPAGRTRTSPTSTPPSATSATSARTCGFSSRPRRSTATRFRAGPRSAPTRSPAPMLTSRRCSTVLTPTTATRPASTRSIPPATSSPARRARSRATRP